MCMVEIRPANGGQDARRFAEAVSSAVGAWATRAHAPYSVAASTRSITVALPGTAGAGLT